MLPVARQDKWTVKLALEEEIRIYLVNRTIINMVTVKRQLVQGTVKLALEDFIFFFNFGLLCLSFYISQDKNKHGQSSKPTSHWTVKLASVEK